MVEDSRESQQLKSDRLFKIAGLAAMAFAITWGLPAFFNWLFFGITVYLFFLSWYVKPREPKAFSYERSGDRTQNPAELRQNAIRKVAVIVAIVIFGIFFLLFLIGIFVGTDESGTVTISESNTEEYRARLAENPNDVDALTEVANRFFENSEYDSAVVYYKRILVVDNRNENALYNLGVSYYNQAQYQKSIDVLKVCAQAYPENGEACLILGHDYYDQQLQEDSFIWYTKAYEKGVRNAFLSHVLAYLYDTKGNVTRALPLYKEAIQLDSSRVDIYTRLAELEPDNAARYTALADKWKSN